MEQLTKREQIALAMLQGKIDITRTDNDIQSEFILDAFNFADLFLDMSTDKNLWGSEE